MTTITTFDLFFSGMMFMLYCLVNSGILTGLFCITTPSLRCRNIWMYLLVKSILSVIIVFGFYAMIAHLFCWTATLGQCLNCICPSITAETFVMQSTMPATILFFVSISFVQMMLIAIPRGLVPSTFVLLISASNAIASLLKLGFVSLWL